MVEMLSIQFKRYTKASLPDEAYLNESNEDEVQELNEEENEVKDMELKSEGECKFCKRVISGRAMAKHLLSCRERKKKLSSMEDKEKVFLLRASADPFFLYFEINSSSTLEKVDDFLRDIWLECCGHLSAFKIDNVTYAYDPQPEYNDRSLKVHLKNILRHGLVFSHEYDFGTTTYLTLKVIDERQGDVKDIEILARNNLPNFKCSCNKPAREICSQCVWEGKGFMCKSCAKKHKCGEDMLLPVVNSPRMGMCGYTGD